MRIISGLYRGRRLAPVRGDIRPTSDRLREALFSVLGETVRGSAWLDAFAGSGAVGIEALSRGARRVIFNDHSHQAVDLIHRNLGLCAITEGYEVHQKDVFALLKVLRSGPLDFVFLDPPYGFARYERLLERVAGSPTVQEVTGIIVEIFKKTRFEIPTENLQVRRTLRCGDSELLFLGIRSGRPQAQ